MTDFKKYMFFLFMGGVGVVGAGREEGGGGE